MREVCPGLFLSCWPEAVAAVSIHGGWSAIDPPFFVVNCTRDLPMLSEHGLRLAVDDDGRDGSVEALAGMLPTVVAEMHARLAAGERVLVHCRAGQQRSPAVAAAYLMHARGVGAAAAMGAVSAKKPDAFFFRANFRGALELFEATRRGP